jgi:hypothetical protein
LKATNSAYAEPRRLYHSQAPAFDPIAKDRSATPRLALFHAPGAGYIFTLYSQKPQGKRPQKPLIMIARAVICLRKKPSLTVGPE